MQIDLAKYSNYELAQIFSTLESAKFQNNNFAKDLLNYGRPALYSKIEFRYLFTNYSLNLKLNKENKP